MPPTEEAGEVRIIIIIIIIIINNIIIRRRKTQRSTRGSNAKKKTIRTMIPPRGEKRNQESGFQVHP